jgi:sigma-B regulation protein RsbQ
VSVRQRNNVHVEGAGPATVVPAHGFGCDQNMWRLLAPLLAVRFRLVLFDGGGLLADLRAPGRFAAQVMVGPSRCYIDDAGYVGGFKQADIDSLLETLESNYLGWSCTMAPAIMGTLPG